jgi:hypothetical protein
MMPVTDLSLDMSYENKIWVLAPRQGICARDIIEAIRVLHSVIKLSSDMTVIRQLCERLVTRLYKSLITNTYFS